MFQLFSSVQYSGLSLSLPKNIHLLTFEPWRKNSILIRFEHILAKDEDQQHSQPVSFDFQDVFRGLNAASIRETTLSANQWKDEANRLLFTTKTTNSNEINTTTEDFALDEPNENRTKRDQSLTDDTEDFTILLNPMEIRTFIVELKPML